MIVKLAKQNAIEVVFEAIVNRNYNDDLFLVLRKNKAGILHEKEAVLSRVLSIIKEEKVIALNRVELFMEASVFWVY